VGFNNSARSKATTSWPFLAIACTHRLVGESSGLAEQYELLEQEHLSQALLAFALPHEELVLPQKSALLLQVDVALPERVHGQQIVAVPQLEPDHALGQPEVFRVTFGHLHELLQQQRILAHPLHGLQQVTCQVHSVAKFYLFCLKHHVILVK